MQATNPFAIQARLSACAVLHLLSVYCGLKVDRSGFFFTLRHNKKLERNNQTLILLIFR